MRTDDLVSNLDACRSGFPISARLPKTVAPLSSFHPWHRNSETRIAAAACAFVDCTTMLNFVVKRPPPQSALTRSTDRGSGRLEHRSNSTPPPCWPGRGPLGAQTHKALTSRKL